MKRLSAKMRCRAMKCKNKEVMVAGIKYDDAKIGYQMTLLL